MAPVWLIEAGGVWWTGLRLDGCNAWGTAQQAVQFARQVDAERVRCYLLPDSAQAMSRTTEHVFVDRDEPALTPSETIFRRLLWLRHGCDFSALYGDDGEMQCNALGCHIDFKRMSAVDIERAFERRGRQLLEASLPPATAGSDGRPDALEAERTIR